MRIAYITRIDEQRVRDRMHHFQKAGHDISHYRHPEEFLNTFSTKPLPDLILMATVFEGPGYNSYPDKGHVKKVFEKAELRDARIIAYTVAVDSATQRTTTALKGPLTYSSDAPSITYCTHRNIEVHDNRLIFMWVQGYEEGGVLPDCFFKRVSIGISALFPSEPDKQPQMGRAATGAARHHR